MTQHWHISGMIMMFCTGLPEQVLVLAYPYRMSELVVPTTRYLRAKTQGRGVRYVPTTSPLFDTTKLMKNHLEQFLEFLPIISGKGTEFKMTTEIIIHF